MLRNAMIFAIGALLFPQIAAAHPGMHDFTVVESLQHALTEYDHLLSMALVGVWLAILASRAFAILRFYASEHGVE
jgi:hydrogenase/urease accessory protein HupE